MRVLHLVSTPFFSGPAEAIVELALAQRRLGHEVLVACDRERTQTAAEEPLVPRLAAVGLLADVGLELSVKSGPRALWRDVRRLASLEYDVLHCHFSHDHLLARLSGSKATLIRSIHAPRSLSRWTPKAAAWTVAFEELLARLPRGAKAMLLPALVGPAFAPATDRAALRATLGLGAGPLVGMVSTFQPSRRHLVAVDAFAQLRARASEARLVLVGDGVDEPVVRQRVAALGLSNAVCFAGYQSGEAFVRWLSALDEVWILGLGNDFAARAAAQAKACGVRVVAVAEGAAASYADVVVSPDARQLAEAALGASRRQVPLRSPADVAADVLALYEAAGSP